MQSGSKLHGLLQGPAATLLPATYHRFAPERIVCPKLSDAHIHTTWFQTANTATITHTPTHVYTHQCQPKANLTLLMEHPVHAGSKLQSNRLGPHSARVYSVDALHVKFAATWHSMRQTQLRKAATV